jgi:membrane fusion protein (multidrug efflux system)
MNNLPTRRLPLAVGTLALLAVGGYWLHARQLESTDDAQIDGDITHVSPRVAGTIAAMHVVENQRVHAGDLVAELEPKELTVAVAQARAAVALARAQLAAEDPSLSIEETSRQAAVTAASSDLGWARAAVAVARRDIERLTAELARGEAIATQARVDRERAAQLARENAVARAEVESRTNADRAAAAGVEALRPALEATRQRLAQEQARLAAAEAHFNEVRLNAPRQLETRRATLEAKQASLDEAKAALALAELNLSYAQLRAPVAGVIAKKGASLGDRVTAEQPIVAIAQVDNLWVTANFRETQLRRMRVGERVDAHVDALDLDLRGTVESLGAATGAQMSLLPPENALGNYVKVVQRIPVRIRLDAGQPGVERLRIGMSVEPTVHLTGPGQ